MCDLSSLLVRLLKVSNDKESNFSLEKSTLVPLQTNVGSCQLMSIERGKSLVEILYDGEFLVDFVYFSQIKLYERCRTAAVPCHVVHLI